MKRHPTCSSFHSRPRPPPVITTSEEIVGRSATVTPSPQANDSLDDEPPLKQIAISVKNYDVWYYYRYNLIKPMTEALFPSIMFGQLQTLSSMYYEKLSDIDKSALQRLLRKPAFAEFISEEKISALDKKIAFGKLIRFVFSHCSGKHLQRKW